MLPSTSSRLEQLSFRCIRHASRLERLLEPCQQGTVLCLRALKHRVERFTSEPVVLKLASSPHQSLRDTSSPPDRLAHPGVHRMAPWDARLGKRAPRVPSPPTVRHPLQPHLPLELAPGDDALYMHKSRVAARTRTSLHHHESQRDDAVDSSYVIRQSVLIARDSRDDRHCTADCSCPHLICKSTPAAYF